MIAIETLREEAASLPLKDRAAFAAYMLQTLPPPDFQVTDEEVARRLRELKSGLVQGLTTEPVFELALGMVGSLGGTLRQGSNFRHPMVNSFFAT